MTEYLRILSRGESLSAEQAADAMHQIMQGKADPVQIAGLLMGLRARGETLDELIALARVMRTYFVPVTCKDPDAIDVCGTGGDGTGTFNISTAAALVCAGAGVTVAKHGNRSVSSKSGSADVLEALGVNVDLGAEGVAVCLEEVGIGFIFARHYHPAMRHVMPVRTALGARTVFNILGPLCNPAGVKRQVIGAFNLETAKIIAHIMHGLGAEHVIALHSEDGLDEASIAAPTTVIDYQASDEAPNIFSINPEIYCLEKANLSSLVGGDARQNASILRSVLDGKSGPCRDVVVLNSALGLWVSGRFESMDDCIAASMTSIDSGAAHARLQMLCEVSNRT